MINPMRPKNLIPCMIISDHFFNFSNLSYIITLLLLLLFIFGLVREAAFPLDSSLWVVIFTDHSPTWRIPGRVVVGGLASPYVKISDPELEISGPDRRGPTKNELK